MEVEELVRELAKELVKQLVKQLVRGESGAFGYTHGRRRGVGL